MPLGRWRASRTRETCNNIIYFLSASRSWLTARWGLIELRPSTHALFALGLQNNFYPVFGVYRVGVV